MCVMATVRAYRARQIRSTGATWKQVAAETDYASPDAAARAVRELEAEEANTARLVASYGTGKAGTDCD